MLLDVQLCNSCYSDCYNLYDDNAKKSHSSYPHANQLNVKVKPLQIEDKNTIISSICPSNQCCQKQNESDYIYYNTKELQILVMLRVQRWIFTINEYE